MLPLDGLVSVGLVGMSQVVAECWRLGCGLPCSV